MKPIDVETGNGVGSASASTAEPAPVSAGGSSPDGAGAVNAAWDAARGLWISPDGLYAWIVERSAWEPYPLWTVIGVDPGFASTGVAVLSRYSDGRVISRGVFFLETHREGHSNVRAGMDDARRIREFWLGFREIMAAFRPAVVGVEAYETHQPKAIEDLKKSATTLVQLGVPSSRDAFITKLSDDRTAKMWVKALAALGEALRDSLGWTPMGLGQAAKTIGVVWICAAVAFEHAIPIYVYEPSAMKKAVTGKATASKENVGLAVENRVVGLREHAAGVVETKRNHVHDAAGHAYTALLEYEKWRNAYIR